MKNVSNLLGDPDDIIKDKLNDIRQEFQYINHFNQNFNLSDVKSNIAVLKNFLSLVESLFGLLEYADKYYKVNVRKPHCAYKTYCVLVDGSHSSGVINQIGYKKYRERIECGINLVNELTNQSKDVFLLGKGEWCQQDEQEYVVVGDINKFVAILAKAFKRVKLEIKLNYSSMPNMDNPQSVFRNDVLKLYCDGFIETRIFEMVLPKNLIHIKDGKIVYPEHYYEYDSQVIEAKMRQMLNLQKELNSKKLGEKDWK